MDRVSATLAGQPVQQDCCTVSAICMHWFGASSLPAVRDSSLEGQRVIPPALLDPADSPLSRGTPGSWWENY
eukprot:4845765-Pyramimonas_sp.AAC.1